MRFLPGLPTPKLNIVRPSKCQPLSSCQCTSRQPPPHPRLKVSPSPDSLPILKGPWRTHAGCPGDKGRAQHGPNVERSNQTPRNFPQRPTPSRPIDRWVATDRLLLDLLDAPLQAQDLLLQRPELRQAPRWRLGSFLVGRGLVAWWWGKGGGGCKPRGCQGKAPLTKLPAMNKLCVKHCPNSDK